MKSSKLVARMTSREPAWKEDLISDVAELAADWMKLRLKNCR